MFGFLCLLKKLGWEEGDHRKISHFYQSEKNVLKLGTIWKFLIFINMRKIGRMQFSFPFFENNRNQILDKFCIKFIENLHWIILNKIFIELKFVEHLRKIVKPAIHLSSNWWEHEKMLAKWEVYRWHFVNRLANHFSHLAFRHSCQTIGIFMKCQRGRYGKFLVESKMNKIGDIARNV